MKQIVLAALAAGAMVGSAAAADLPSRKAPMIEAPLPVFTWTGFYAGVNLGVTFENRASVQNVATPIYANPIFPAGAGAIASSLAIALSSSPSSASPASLIGGGQAGYNFQFSPSVLLGLEADFSGITKNRRRDTSFVTTSLAPFGFPESYTASTSAGRRLDWLGTARGRIGYVAYPSILVYGTGGLAFGGTKLNTLFAAQESLGTGVYPAVFDGTNYSKTRVGYTVGGGLEWMFMPNWSIKGEYLYYSLGRVTTAAPVTQVNTGVGAYGVAARLTSTRFNGNVVRAGINYHFNFGGYAPVVARY